jgi:hypothetical protein
MAQLNLWAQLHLKILLHLCCLYQLHQLRLEDLQQVPWGHLHQWVQYNLLHQQVRRWVLWGQ